MTETILKRIVWVSIALFTWSSIITYIEHHDVLKLVSDISMAGVTAGLNYKFVDSD